MDGIRVGTTPLAVNEAWTWERRDELMPVVQALLPLLAAVAPSWGAGAAAAREMLRSKERVWKARMVFGCALQRRWKVVQHFRQANVVPDVLYSSARTVGDDSVVPGQFIQSLGLYHLLVKLAISSI
jgi:hypothetical protein